MVLEQFKNSLPKHIAVHLNEKEVTGVRIAAEMADNYVLVCQEPWIAEKKLGPPRQFEERFKKEGKSERGFTRSQEFSRFPKDIICHLCKKHGHIKPRCPALQKFVEGELEAPVTLLTDTGAAQSLILKDFMDLPPHTAEGSLCFD